MVFADTIGGASPKEVSSLLAKSVRAFGREKLAVHFHDTQALGMTNACMALENGVTTFDSSIGGLGGCPFAPGAAGNLATEDVVYLAERMGFQTSLDIEALWRSVGIAEEITGLKLGGRTRAYYESKKQQG